MAIITTLEVGASCVAHARFLNTAGAAGDIADIAVWVADNSGAASITVQPDGLSAVIVRLTADPVNITVTGKSITAGGADIVVSAALPMPAVVANPAVSAVLTFEDS